MLKLLVIPAVALLIASPALAAPGDTPSPAPNTDRPSRANSGIMRYDTNKDGVVDRAEWKAGQEARFKRLDANNDGKLTQDELFARTPAVGNSVLPSDRQVERQSAYFQRVDANKDGVVTLEEFMAQGDRNFARCDVNKDGRDGYGRMPAGAAAQSLTRRNRKGRPFAGGLSPRRGSWQERVRCSRRA